MRTLLVIFIGLLASLAMSLAVWSAIERRSTVWCEVVDPRLLRTTATESQINAAVADVMAEERPPTADASESLAKSGYHEHADSWFKANSLIGLSKERLSSLLREEIDRAGCLLRIKTLHGPEMPSLVFVEHDPPAAESTVAARIAERLARQGVPIR